jgi:hypothetical protein
MESCPVGRFDVGASTVKGSSVQGEGGWGGADTGGETPQKKMKRLSSKADIRHNVFIRSNLCIIQ